MDIGQQEPVDAAQGQVLMSAVDYSTSLGNAHLAIDVPPSALGVLMLGHGAGGDIDAPDLVAVRRAALVTGVAVVRMRQPYRVAGRKAPAPAAQLDTAFAAVLTGVRSGELPGLSAGLRVLVGGRSSGARVAARVGRAAGAVGLLTLAFPLSPPGRPTVSRIDELAGAGLPTLAVQGSRDGFGSATDLRAALERWGPLPVGQAVEVAEIADADHSFRTRRLDPTTTAQALATVTAVVQGWLGAWPWPR